MNATPCRPDTSALDYITPELHGILRIIIDALAAQTFVTKERLIELIWTPFNEPTDPDNVLNAHMARLRARLKPPCRIRTIAGGYLLEPCELPWPVTGAITRCQRIVLEILMDRRLHTVGHFNEVLYGSRPRSPITIKTFISLIRRKLEPGWSIELVGPETYQLRKR